MTTNVPHIPFADFTWTWNGSQEWVTRATISQNQLYTENSGRMYDASPNYDHIEIRILNSAFGNPTSTGRSMATQLNHSYTRPQRKIAIKIRKKMQKYARTEVVNLNAIYVMSYLKEGLETMVPVFYFETHNNFRKYIDLQARIYDNWKHFLETNVIDPSLCCYPVNGTYAQTQTSETPTFDENIQIELKVSESPSCGLFRTAGRWVQKTLTYGTYILMAASMVATVSGAQCIARFSKLNSWCNKMKLIKPYINQAQKFTQYANAATAIASSILNIHDKITHDQEELLADVTLIVSSVLSILSDPINRAIVKGGVGGKDLANAKFTDLSPISRIFLQLFSMSRCASSILSVVTIMATMLLKDECTGSDYFNLASSLFTCYGTVTSPLTAKKIFEQVQQEYISEQFNVAKKQEEARKASANNTNEVGVAEAAVIAGAVVAGADAVINKATEDSSISGNENSSDNQPNEKNQCVAENSNGLSCKRVANESDNEPKEFKNSDESGYCPNKEPAANNSAPNNNPSGDGSGNPNDPKKPPSNHNVEETATYKNNPKTNNAGVRGPPPSTDAEKEELIKQRDELAKNIIKDENDEAGKAAKEYYEKNILLVFRGTENEHVMNQQLVRMMQAADNIRDVFCEIALTETTFDIKNGVLFINGQLNIDGAAFAATTNNLKESGETSNVGQRLLDKLAAEARGEIYKAPENAVKTDREKIMKETKFYDEEKEAIIENNKDNIKSIAERREKERAELVETRKKMEEGYLKSVDKKREEMKESGASEEKINQEEKEFQKKFDVIKKNTAGMLEKFDIKTENDIINYKDEADGFRVFKKEYRIVFETHINEFEQSLANLGLTDFEIDGKKVFKDLNAPDYFRLIQQFEKDNVSTDNGDSMKAAMIMAEKVKFTSPEGIAACHQQVLNEMYAHIGKETQSLRSLRQEFFNNFNDPTSDVAVRLAENFSAAIDQTQTHLTENHPGGAGTSYRHRYDLNNEDPRLVAAMIFVHVTEGGKNTKRREWTQEERVNNAQSYISTGSEQTGKLRLSQDGTKWILKWQNDEE